LLYVSSFLGPVYATADPTDRVCWGEGMTKSGIMYSKKKTKDRHKKTKTNTNTNTKIKTNTNTITKTKIKIKTKDSLVSLSSLSP
jgi:hypothetical protein